MGLVLALGLGPVVGGLTTDAFGWRYIFFVPLPFVAAALVLGALFLARRPPRRRPSSLRLDRLRPVVHSHLLSDDGHRQRSARRLGLGLHPDAVYRRHHQRRRVPAFPAPRRRRLTGFVVVRLTPASPRQHWWHSSTASATSPSPTRCRFSVNWFRVTRPPSRAFCCCRRAWCWSLCFHLTGRLSDRVAPVRTPSPAD